MHCANTLLKFYNKKYNTIIIMFEIFNLKYIIITRTSVVTFRLPLFPNNNLRFEIITSFVNICHEGSIGILVSKKVTVEICLC